MQRMRQDGEGVTALLSEAARHGETSIRFQIQVVVMVATKPADAVPMRALLGPLVVSGADGVLAPTPTLELHGRITIAIGDVRPSGADRRDERVEVAQDRIADTLIRFLFDAHAHEDPPVRDPPGAGFGFGHCPHRHGEPEETAPAERKVRDDRVRARMRRADVGAQGRARVPELAL